MPADETDDELRPSAVTRVLTRLGEKPWEIFAILGTIVFTLGWAGILYLMFSSSDSNPVGLLAAGGTEGKVYFMVSTGPMVTIASGVLWGIAALTWRRQSKPE